MIGRSTRSGLFVGVAVLLAKLALADGIIIIPPIPPHPPRPHPPLPRPVPQVTPLEIRVHRATVEITEGQAITRVDQVFYNPNNMQLEGTYLFPLPEEAAISKFSMFIDGKETPAELLDRDQARKIYEDIVRTMRDPALLEYVDRRTFRACVFPIPPNGEKRIKLEYSEPLPLDAGVRTYRYPLATEKFSGKPLKEATIEVSIRSKLPIKSIVSPSHKVDVTQKSDYEARVGYEAHDTLPDKDFVLYITVSKADFGLHLVSYREKGEDGYFLAMISPGMEVETEKVIEKDIVLCLDTSGSMGEQDKIGQARSTLKFCLRSLNPGDRFAIVDFATTARTFREELVPATEDNVRAALAYVDQLQARGGTAIYEALETALKMAPTAGERPFMVVLITDGRPTVGPQDTEQIIQGIKKSLRSHTRIFTLGVGHDVNTHLLDRLAEENRGTRGYILPGENLEEKVSAFYRKIASPVLADLKLEFRNIQVTEVYPRTLGDLFRGSQLTVVGRYSGSGDRAIVLSGTVGGKARQFTYEAKFAEEDTTHEFLPRYWATKKIGYLLDEIRLRGEHKELKDEIVRLSKKFGIMTPYTSFLVVEDAKQRVAAGQPVPTAPAARFLEERHREAIMRAADAVRAESGAGAVRFSLEARKMQAEGFAAPEEFLGASAREVVVQVGAQTFYKRDGVWVISSYVEGKPTLRVNFLSDEYFALARKSPTLARAFALGERVIAEWEGKFYEVVVE